MDLKTVETPEWPRRTTPTPQTLNLPPVNSLTTAPTGDRTYVLDLLFEPSQPLHNLALPLLNGTEFASYDDLIVAVGVQLTELAESSSTSDTAWLEQILGAHPRLGEKKVESAQSRAEQANLNKAGPEAEAEAAELKKLNEEYEKTFPGLRYVVFVNGRSRPDIFNNMRERIGRGDIKAERNEAIKAMCQIASDRARKLQS
ncbi:Oxo-4-hydroxy-4-carboxy-5-ureidoimidazoline decarboxylase [Botryosphaeria dothidea]|uniref:Oxo-4-hydroxy-4-carboxy-5-ureidoimidazoline decarboxylase n=1 Tax=Botryosphaeria dothidea TaxID=55169 RepID=A0A8H4IX23_9PEZI|nr:Oxo-4-hydroxy-4-carboxy-5-ureidoimidazoline decarboxylase [Botryosphaeria dothidea]